MQNAKREKKKQTKLSPPGATPEVLNPQVISPHHIEREIFLKKIETLRYTTREQKRTIARLKADLKLTDLSLDELVKKLESKQALVNVLHSNIKNNHRLYKDLDDAYMSMAKDFVQTAQLNSYLLLSKDCKPDIRRLLYDIYKSFSQLYIIFSMLQRFRTSSIFTFSSAIELPPAQQVLSDLT